jgi:hypothetical protein
MEIPPFPSRTAVTRDQWRLGGGMTLMCIKPLDISAALMPLDRSPDDAAASGGLDRRGLAAGTPSGAEAADRI